MLKKVFITGASGFIGSHLAKGLLEDGWDVKAFVRASSKTSFLNALKIELATGDLLDYTSIKNAMAGCEVVYHCATKRNCNKFDDYYRTNVIGAENIMRAARENEVQQVIYLSSSHIYGKQQQNPITEAVKPNPISFHGQTKLMTENIIKHWSINYNIPSIIVRLPLVIGPRNHATIPLFSNIKNKRTILLGTGEVLRSTIDIEDLTNGLKLCLKAKRIYGECFNMANPQPLTTNQLFSTISKAIGRQYAPVHLPKMPFLLSRKILRGIPYLLKQEPSLLKRIDFFLTNQFIDVSKANRELKFAPKVTPENSISNAVQWAMENDLLRK